MLTPVPSLLTEYTLCHTREFTDNSVKLTILFRDGLLQGSEGTSVCGRIAPFPNNISLQTQIAILPEYGSWAA
jgi:hypothetical protein